MPRLFIAIDLPDEHKERIAAICYPIPGVRWIPEEQIHLTLRFIGDVDPASFKQIIAVLSEVRAEPFEIKVRGIGHFPPRRTPRVLWLGIDKNAALLQLRNRIEAKLKLSGLTPEGRKFSPHITISRLKDPPLARVVEFMAGHSLFELPSFRVDNFQLYSSQLKSNGAIHTIEASYPLSEK